MKLPRRQFLHLAAGAAALPAVSRFAFAQAYPSLPVRIIWFRARRRDRHPRAPGEPQSLSARVFAPRLNSAYAPKTL
jgi:hypothetical protein